jgi:uncharacterized protein YjbI with pentapeptide repeats
VPTKIELINKLNSLEHRHVLQAVEELRVCDWLSDGTLRGAALCRTQLQRADLTRADLRDVDFSKADLTSADLYKANLQGARNLTEEQLRRVKRLCGAIMPDGETYNGCYNLSGDLAQARWAKVDLNDPQAMADFYCVPLETYLRGQKAGVKRSLPEA